MSTLTGTSILIGEGGFASGGHWRSLLDRPLRTGALGQGAALKGGEIFKEQECSVPVESALVRPVEL